MSYRYLWLSVCFTVCSVLLMSSAARAQVDIESMRSIVAQCPDVGSATIGGLPATFMCADINGTPLDDPIRPGAGSLDRIHAGSFSLELRQQLLTAARPYIGETRFEELQTRIGNGQIISQAAEHERRASLSEAAWLEAAGNAAGAAALRARGAALLHVDPTDLSSPFLFEAAITGADGGVALLDTRADIPRLPDLQSGLLTSQSVADTVSEYAPGLTQDMNQDVLIGVPAGLDQRKVRRNAIPFFLGPDGLANTADDLPFETGGLIRATPFAGTNDPYNPSTAGLPGRPRFIASGQVADRNGVSRELYGVFEPNHLSFRGCALNSQLLGGTLFTYNSATHTCTDNATGASIPDVYTVFDPAVYGALTPDQKALADKVFTLGCSEQADRAYNFTDTRMAGLNADGDCIRMNSDGVNSSTDRIHFDVLPLLGDTRFRPAGASLEPTNLTDLVTGPGAPIARPKSPTGTILFPNTPPFERLVDPNTGAPMLAGGTSCTYRTDATDTRIGPNGIAGDTDDIFPSAGDCLLWGPPGADGRQFLRSEDPIAIGHTADQTLFHTLCTLGFDEDYGVCAGDSFNTPWTFFLTTDLLSGFGALTGLAIPGIETIRLPRAGNNLMKLDDVITLGQFALADPTARDSVVFQNLAVSLIPEQQAIYGCGQLEASACHSNQQVSWVNDPVIESTIDRDLSTPGVKLSELPGGIDAMNAAGDVWTSEFAMVKATRAGTLVGTHLTAAGRQFLPGINLTRFADPNGLTGFLDRSPAEISALSEADLAALAQSRETDGWIEEFPWRLDPFWEARGVILLQADPNDPVSGPLNIFNSTGGEYCGEWFGPNPFSVGCSALETISANFERILIAQEIVGPARTFDAYETIAELQAALVGFAGGMTADPISGPDGLFAYNARIFNGEFVGRAVKDAVVVTARNPAGRELDMPAGGYSADPAIARDEARAFVLAYDPVNDCTNTALCILEVTNAMAEFGNTTDRIAAATPLSYGASDPIGNSLRINLLALELVDPLAFYGLLNDDPGHYVEVPNSVLGLGAAGTTEVQIDALNLLGSQSSSYTGLDIDGDGITDMDRDNDGIHDGADDFTPGPMGVNNPFCGSGIPGDLFQDPIQFEPAFADEAPGTAKFATAFPDGLPPRSPVFCRSLQSWMLRVGEQSPGNYGFIWHGGALPAGSDPDADGRPGDIDNCPTIANIDQADPDGDGVGSACDNCINIYNPRIALAPGSTQTTTGGQPDDDADGLGNACDVQFAARSASHTSVDASDIALFKGAINKTVDSDTCPAVADKGGSTACELYDADGNRSGYMIAINGFDIEAFKNMIGLDPTLEQCSACPLECEGDACTP